MEARRSGLEILEQEKCLESLTIERYPEEVIEYVRTIKQETPLNLEDSSLEEPLINLENNIVICETYYIEEQFEPLPDEEETKPEIIELGEYKLACAENDSVDESKNDDNLPVCKELIIRLEKLDYSSLVEPKSKRNRGESLKKCEDLVIRLEKLDSSSLLKTSSRSEPPRKCEHCGQTFSSKYRLAVHKVKNHAPIMMLRNFHCDQCDKSYQLQTNLAIHRAKIHGIGEVIGKRKRPLNHTCKHCKKLFTTWKSLIYHRTHIHGESIDSTKFVRCSSCNTKFATSEEMAEHHCLKGAARIRARSFKCDLCDKAYFDKFPLMVHYSSHPKYHKFKCDQCSKGFFNEVLLNFHKKSLHISEEAYPECQTCKKRFKTRQILKHHQKVVHPDPATVFHRYQCSYPQCVKSFVTKYCAERHEKAHARVHKYKCKLCQYGSARRSRVLLHEQRRHNSEVKNKEKNV